MRQYLHISMDFEARDYVRTLCRKLRDRGVPEPGALACVYAFRLWCDWGRQGTDWRPLSGVEPVDWTQENIAYLIEEYCGWPEGQRGELMRLFIESDTLQIVKRDELLGLSLREYAFYNQHLLPDYVSRESKGGHVKAANARLRQIDELAKQQSSLFARQDVLLFQPEAQVTEDERRKAIGVVMKLDMAFGLPTRRTDEYPESVMRDALALIRRCSTGDIDTVARWIYGQRETVSLAKDPLLVIRDFDEFLRKARAE